MTTKQVSEFLKVRRSTVTTWASNGTLKGEKVNYAWRFDSDSVEAWAKVYTPKQKGTYRRGVKNPFNNQAESQTKMPITTTKEMKARITRCRKQVDNNGEERLRELQAMIGRGMVCDE